MLQLGSFGMSTSETPLHVYLQRYNVRGEREGLPSMLATSFAEVAGVSGRQKWGLVLSSSARVSQVQVTYQTVVGVRYPELVTYNGTQWKFGKYVQQESPLPGGFLPLFVECPTC